MQQMRRLPDRFWKIAPEFSRKRNETPARSDNLEFDGFFSDCSIYASTNTVRNSLLRDKSCRDTQVDCHNFSESDSPCGACCSHSTNSDTEAAT